MSKKPSAAETAKSIKDCADRNGFTLSISNSLLIVSKRFNPGDTEAFKYCDAMAPHVLDLMPHKKGDSSVFGTDGGSVGGAIALNNGRFELKKTGCSKLVLKALAKII